MKCPEYPADIQLAGVRLLLVEDNALNREFVAELLRSLGLEVDEAENGRIAVAKVQRQDYDAVLMDIQMPEMDGLEATRRIRALAHAPNGARFAGLPIIAITASALDQDAEKCRMAGMTDYLAKPISPERLVAVLEKWAPLPSMPQSGEIPPGLPASPRLDTCAGIRRIGGQADAYYKQLRRFREHYATRAMELQRLIAEKNIQAAEEYCHTLKGISGNIGANALYESVAAVDALLKQGKMPAPAALENLGRLLRQVMSEIDGIASALPAVPIIIGTPQTRAEILAQIDLLAALLDNDMGAAESMLAELRAGVAGSASEQAVNEIAARVDEFAIDEALALLGVLRSRLQAA
ncbi:MAG: response regulator [Sulfuricellaceae bacterium]